MITIAEAISDLLFLHTTVVVPGLGAFTKSPVSAKVNPVANYFTAPNCNVEFDAKLREDNELVVNYLAKENNWTVGEAKKQLAVFVSDCFNSLKQGEKVELDSIGTLYYDGDRMLVFEPARSVNYNADAFGLCDFMPQPVQQSKSKEELKVEIEQRHKEKNTPVTVDEEAVHQDDNNRPVKKKGWWIAAAAVIVLLFTLFHFDIIPFDFNKEGKEGVVLVKELPKETTGETQEMGEQGNVELPAAEPQVKDTFRIIAGIYDREEFAQRIVVSLQNKGFEQAYKMKRGDRWYVAYAWYPTEEEAISVLREIRESGKGKGWILK